MMTVAFLYLILSSTWIHQGDMQYYINKMIVPEEWHENCYYICSLCIYMYLMYSNDFMSWNLAKVKLKKGQKKAIIQWWSNRKEIKNECLVYFFFFFIFAFALYGLKTDCYTNKLELNSCSRVWRKSSRLNYCVSQRRNQMM